MAANGALREIRSILAAAGVPPHVVSIRPYQTEPDKLATIRLNFSKIVAQAGPCGLWPGDLGPVGRTCLSGKPPLLESRLRHRSAISRRWSSIRPISCSRAAKIRSRPIAAASCSTSIARVKPTNTQFRNEDRGKLSDIGK